MKVIMVPVADRPECRIALDQAFGLATELNANIIGCHLRPHRTESTAPRKRGGSSAPRQGHHGALTSASFPPGTSRSIDNR